MPIIATIPPGMTSVTVSGLHQWDYGQTLEIRSDITLTVVEVHFACEGMREAVVRSCPCVLGRILAKIPDACLEQTTPVVAWIYEVGQNSGRTLARVVIQVEPRVKPAVSASGPDPEIGDRYTEAVAAMNDAVAALCDGQVTAANAINAEVAVIASEAPDRGEQLNDVETGAGRSFKFRDTNGFGAGDNPGESGYFKVRIETDERGIKHCNLLPSKAEHQDLGEKTKRFRTVYASKVDSTLVNATSVTANRVSAAVFGLTATWTEGDQLPGVGTYYIRTLDTATGDAVDFGLLYWDGTHTTEGCMSYGGEGHYGGVAVSSRGGITLSGEMVSPTTTKIYFRKVFD